MNDQAVASLKRIESSLEQLKVLCSLVERAAASAERMEQIKQVYPVLEKIAADGQATQELKSIANLLERIATSNERIENLLQKSWESYTKISEKR